MAYIKNTWVDREGTTRYQETIDEDGTLIFTPDYEKVTEMGTPVNADNMNHIEDGIVDHENRITVLESADNASNFLNKSQITNCLLEVPQRIKYDLTDGVLTIKAGSVVIVPYGTEDLTAQYPVGSTFLNDNFKVADTQFADGKFFVWAELMGDILADQKADNTNLIISLATSTPKAIYGTASVTADTTPTASTSYKFLYNTAENKCLEDLGYWDTCCFPIIIADRNSTEGFTNIKQVFNGMGYIGSTVWVDKGVKGLIPNGRNTDGSLKNVEFVTSKLDTTEGNSFTGTTIRPVWLYSNGNISTGVVLYEQETPPTINSSGVERWFNTAENVWYYHASGETAWRSSNAGCVFGYVTSTDGVITKFQPKQPFHAADIQDVVRKTGDTIEGQLTVKGSHGGILAIQNSNIDLTTVPSSHQYMGIKFLDKNGTIVGTIDIRQDASTGVSHFMLGNHQSDGIYSVTPANTDSSTKIATTAFVKNVLSTSGAGLATISKAANGYCKFNNGLIIQWGTVKTTSDTSATWTFATAFTSTNYRVVSNYLLAQDGNYSSTVSNKSTTNCKIWANNQTVECIAIGY